MCARQIRQLDVVEVFGASCMSLRGAVAIGGGDKPGRPQTVGQPSDSELPYKFSKVGFTHDLLCKKTVELTFEKFYQPECARVYQHRAVALPAIVSVCTEKAKEEPKHIGF